jgi:hypothetical protein
MNKIYENFGDCIPDLGTQLGVSSLEYLPVAIRQARYYGFEEVARWFETAEKRLQDAIQEEWDEKCLQKPIKDEWRVEDNNSR